MIASFRRPRLIIALLAMFFVTSCGTSQTSEEVRVKIASLPVKIAFAAGGATVEVLAEEFAGVRIDSKDLLRQIFPSLDPYLGSPSGENPVLMVVNKNNNGILYWQLSNNVKMISLKHERPGAIELKVINESPLRVELWIEGDIKEIEVEIELKN